MLFHKLTIAAAALCALAAPAVAGVAPPVIQATASAPIAISTATTTQIIALSTLKTYITGWEFISAGSGTVQLEYGTGTACGTVAGTLTGAYPVSAGTGLSRGGIGPVIVVPAGNEVCVVTTSSATAQGSIAYAQY